MTLIALLLQGCATTSASSKTAARKKIRQGHDIPALSESYAFDDNDMNIDQHIRKRGNKSRGTHEY
jgi:hypothetical protein